MEQNQFNDNVKAVAALLTTIIAGVGAYIGLPGFVSAEGIAAVAGAITAAASVFFLIRGNKAPAPPAA
jgi:hypothetical protein